MTNNIRPKLTDTTRLMLTCEKNTQNKTILRWEKNKLNGH